MSQVMRCKLQLHGVERYADRSMAVKGKDGHTRYVPDPSSIAIKVKFGAVYEGTKEAQQQSENAVFGDATPSASFEATIKNPALVDALTNAIGREFYVDFSLAPMPERVLLDTPT